MKKLFVIDKERNFNLNENPKNDNLNDVFQILKDLKVMNMITYIGCINNSDKLFLLKNNDGNSEIIISEERFLSAIGLMDNLNNPDNVIPVIKFLVGPDLDLFPTEFIELITEMLKVGNKYEYENDVLLLRTNDNNVYKFYRENVKLYVITPQNIIGEIVNNGLDIEIIWSEEISATNSISAENFINSKLKTIREYSKDLNQKDFDEEKVIDVSEFIVGGIVDIEEWMKQFPKHYSNNMPMQLWSLFLDVTKNYWIDIPETFTDVDTIAETVSLFEYSTFNKLTVAEFNELLYFIFSQFDFIPIIMEETGDTIANLKNYKRESEFPFIVVRDLMDYYIVKVNEQTNEPEKILGFEFDSTPENHETFDDNSEPVKSLNDKVMELLEDELSWNNGTCIIAENKDTYSFYTDVESWETLIVYSGLPGQSILKDIRKLVNTVTTDARVFIISNKERNSPHSYGILLTKKK